MVRASSGPRPPAGQRPSGSVVSADAPAAWRGLIDGASHDRMTEPETAGHARQADEVARQQVVDRLPGLLFADVGGSGSQFELERITGDRRTLQEPPAVARQQCELLR